MKSRSQRNLGVEALRAIAMLAIVSRHVLSWSNCPSWMPRMLGWGVVAFAFISGYYGIRFKLSRLFGLWLLAAVVSLIPWLVMSNVFGQEVGYWHLLFSNWYLNSYSILCLFSPLLECALKNARDHLAEVVAPLFICMCWSWGQEFPGIKEVLPQVPGFGKYSFFALAYIYIAARCCRLGEWFLRTPKSFYICVLVCTLCLFPLFCNTTNIVTLVFVMVMFRMFEGLKIPRVIGCILSFLTPSLFSVYLLHTNELGAMVVRLIMSTLSWNVGIRCVIAILLIFIGCCLIDVLRRCLLVPIRPLLSKVSDAVDAFYVNVINRFAKFV